MKNKQIPTTIEAIFKANGEKFPFYARKISWNSDYYVRLLAVSRDGTWFTESPSGISECFYKDKTEWLPHTPPKSKVMRAQYAYRASEIYHPVVTLSLYRYDVEFLAANGKPIWFKRLAEVECES
jgi:hypothetical protein